MSTGLKKLEDSINKELQTFGLLPIYIEGIDVLPSGPVLKWTTPYDDNVCEYVNEINRTWEIVSEYYEHWRNSRR